MLNFRTNILLCLLSFTFIIACSNDEQEPPVLTDDTDQADPTDDSEATLQEEQEETIITLTNGSEQVWRIAEASIDNASGTIEVSSNFNVVDDEFIFSGNTSNGNLEWRQGNAIELTGTTSQETLLDFYKAPVNTQFTFDEGSSVNITALDGDLIFEVVDQNTIKGTLSSSGMRNTSETLTFILKIKTSSDYIAPPADGLTFTPAFTYNSNSVVCCAPGMIGSYSDNSFFIATRENIDFGTTESIVKFDVDTGLSTQSTFDQSDFVSKQLHIINNTLVVMGGQYANYYPLDLSDTPTSIAHGKRLTRFGLAVQENNAYFIGGDLNVDENGNPVDADKVFKFDIEDGTTTEVATLPENRFGARGTIVNNKLYVFGGLTSFPDGNGTNSIYTIDLESGVIETSNLPVSIDYSFVSKYQNLIYIAGKSDIRDDAGNITGRDHFLAYYDTETGVLEEISTNLQGTSEDLETIHGMTVFNNKIYILYGDNLDNDNDTTTPTPNSILVANLN